MYSLSTNNRRQKFIISPVYMIHYFYFFLNFRMERMDEVTKRPSVETWKYCRIFVRSPFVFPDRSSILERFRRTVMTTTEPLQSKLTLGGMWAQIFVKGPAMIKTTYFLSYLKRRWNMSEWAKIPFVNKINLVLILGTAGDRILLRKNTMILTDCLSRRRPPEGTCRSRIFTTRPSWGRLPSARARSLPCTPWGASAPTRGRRVHSRRWPGRGDPSLVSRSRKRRINNWTWTWGWF